MMIRSPWIETLPIGCPCSIVPSSWQYDKLTNIRNKTSPHKTKIPLCDKPPTPVLIGVPTSVKVREAKLISEQIYVIYTPVVRSTLFGRGLPWSVETYRTKFH